MRKMVGGGMRQAGILAAAGIVALTQMVERLAEDHEDARFLAEGLAEIPGLHIDPASVRTNIVIFSLVAKDVTPKELAWRLNEKGVKLLPIEGNRLRAVTHYGLERGDIEIALRAFSEVMKRP
jgi:threonine aldolase